MHRGKTASDRIDRRDRSENTKKRRRRDTFGWLTADRGPRWLTSGIHGSQRSEPDNAGSCTRNGLRPTRRSAVNGVECNNAEERRDENQGREPRLDRAALSTRRCRGDFGAGRRCGTHVTHCGHLATGSHCAYDPFGLMNTKASYWCNCPSRVRKQQASRVARRSQPLSWVSLRHCGRSARGVPLRWERGTRHVARSSLGASPAHLARSREGPVPMRRCRKEPKKRRALERSDLAIWPSRRRIVCGADDACSRAVPGPKRRRTRGEIFFASRSR